MTDAAPLPQPATTEAAWLSIDSAPKDQELLVFTQSWGVIIAMLSSEFGQWLSRMQVPVTISADGELPSHWQPLPSPPGNAAPPA